MRHTRSILLRAALAILATTLLVASSRASVNETVLHTFNPTGAEAFPYAGLTADSAGNLYGTTYYGGDYNYGTVFELMPAQGGGWTQKVLHSFNFNGTDGAFPYAGVVFDGAGNLYTTTQSGGTHYAGTAVELSPSQGGVWTEKVLHSFSSTTTDGVDPLAGLVIDHAGNLYGTTYGGGFHYSGTVFELSPNGSGDWTETVLYRFTSSRGTGRLSSRGKSDPRWGRQSLWHHQQRRHSWQRNRVYGVAQQQRRMDREGAAQL